MMQPFIHRTSDELFKVHSVVIVSPTGQKVKYWIVFPFLSLQGSKGETGVPVSVFCLLDFYVCSWVSQF